MGDSYGRTSQYYDKIYAWKDYPAETKRLLAILGGPQEPRQSLLDVACGTGRHLELLGEVFDVEGLDVSPDQLAIARARNPLVPFHCADMTDFALGREFDVVTCLFSSIGYARTIDRLHAAVGCMARHVKQGGALVIEPWFTPTEWRPHSVHASFVDDPELKIARINTSLVAGRVSLLDLHYLIGTPDGTEHFVEHHELGLFTEDEMRAALERPGWNVSHDAQGLSGRGLYLARRGAA